MAHLLALYLTGILITFTIPSILADVLMIDPYTNISTQIGSTVNLSCFGPAANTRGISFFENGGKLVWKADGNIIASSSILEGSGFVQSGIASKYSSFVTTQGSHNGDAIFFTLQIDNISVDDSKRYSCALLSDQNVLEVESAFVRLRVHFPPNKLHPLCTVDSISSDSSHATLKCRSETAVPPVHLKWVSSRVSFKSNVKKSNPQSFSEADIDIEITQFSDVRYTCVMKYTGDFEQSIRNCTLYTPKISLDPTYQDVFEGDDAEFKCSVSAEPKPTQDAQWFSFPTLNGTNFTNHFSNSISTLTIRNVTLVDNGTQITCRSQNIIGENQEMAFLLVKAPIEVMVTPQNIRIQVGETAVVECLAFIKKTIATSMNKSKLEYTWYYEDQEISNSEVSEKFSIEQFPFQRFYVRNVTITDNNTTISCVVNCNGLEKRAQTRLIVSNQNDQSPIYSVNKSHRHDLSPGFICLILFAIFCMI